MISDSFTLTDCYGIGEPDYLVTIKLLMLAVVPVAIGYMLWRIFVTNRAGSVTATVFGLNENSATFSESSSRRIPWRTVFLYVLTGATFAFEVYKYVMDLLPAWSDS